MNRQFSVFDHLHPRFAFTYQPSFEIQPHGILASLYARLTLIFIKILNCIPGKLICVLKRLNETLLLKLIQFLFGKKSFQLSQRFVVI
jgi:hypothetical protein